MEERWKYIEWWDRYMIKNDLIWIDIGVLLHHLSIIIILKKNHLSIIYLSKNGRKKKESNDNLACGEGRRGTDVWILMMQGTLSVAGHQKCNGSLNFEAQILAVFERNRWLIIWRGRDRTHIHVRSTADRCDVMIRSDRMVNCWSISSVWLLNANARKLLQPPRLTSHQRFPTHCIPARITLIHYPLTDHIYTGGLH